METTKVIFRKWSDAHKTDLCEIIAIFPEIPSNIQSWNCLSYEHCGQHSGADPHIIISRTTPATDKEAKDLKEELEQIGYHLVIRRRFPVNAFETRKKNQPFYGQRD